MPPEQEAERLETGTAAASSLHGAGSFPREEEETLAQRVKRRGDRKQREHHVGSYQNMETQQALASEERERRRYLERSTPEQTGEAS